MTACPLKVNTPQKCPTPDKAISTRSQAAARLEEREHAVCMLHLQTLSRPFKLIEQGD